MLIVASGVATDGMTISAHIVDTRSSFNPLISKLPIRQLISSLMITLTTRLSKLPIRQLMLTHNGITPHVVSKLPIRQLMYWLA